MDNQYATSARIEYNALDGQIKSSVSCGCFRRG